MEMLQTTLQSNAVDYMPLCSEDNPGEPITQLQAPLLYPWVVEAGYV